MQVNQTTWQDLKEKYYHNLMVLKASIGEVQNSIIEMNRIYSDVIKKSEKTNLNTRRIFANSWIKKIDEDNMGEFPNMKKEHEKIIKNPSEKNLQDFGVNLQQKLYNNSISRLNTYQASMSAFYDTWKEMWPEKSN